MTPTVQDRPARPLSARRARPWFHGVVWLTLVGLFVVCHGCHGDEDTELSAVAHREKAPESKANRLHELPGESIGQSLTYFGSDSVWASGGR